MKGKKNIENFIILLISRETKNIEVKKNDENISFVDIYSVYVMI